MQEQTTSPFFSIVVPTFNRAHLIEKTLQSVIHQTFQDFEIIVVDNCSTDDTAAIMQPFLADKRIQFIKQEQNFERAVSRNKGFTHASGKFVSLLDSDDVLYPSCLQDAYNFAQLNPTFAFFQCMIETIDEEGKSLRKEAMPPISNQFKCLAEGNFISSIGIFIERQVLDSVRVDETPVLIGMEDYDFAMHLLNHCGKIGLIPKINCGVLYHPQRTVLIQDLPTIIARVQYFIEKNTNGKLFQESFAPFKTIFISNNLLYLCGAAAIRKMPWSAFKFWLQALVSDFKCVGTLKFWKHFLVIIKYMF